MGLEQLNQLQDGTWETYRNNREKTREAWFTAKESSKPSWEKQDFMEDQMFTMPLIEDGVFGIGDLFNIRTVKPVGASLIYYNRLTAEHLVAHPRKQMDYTFDLISDTMDLLDTLKVTADLSISMAFSGGTNLNISGTALFDSFKSRNFYDQQIRCNYENETFSVQLQPSAVEGEFSIVNENIRAQLIQGKLEATHVCTEVIVGGKAITNIYDKTDDEKDNMTIGGTLKFFMKMAMVEINANAAVDFVKNQKADHKDTRIIAFSKPPFKRQPNTIPDMFQCIQEIPDSIAEEKHFRMFDGSDGGPVVTGVPLRYKLTPIGQVIELPEGAIRKSFRKVEASLLNAFLVVAASLKDYQSKEFIKRKIYEREPRTYTMLLDADNPLTMEITKWETELAAAAKTIQYAADEAWQEYKEIGSEDTDPAKIRDVINTFDERIGVLNVFQKIEDFRRACKKEIVGIHLSDTDEEIKVTFLSNEIDLEDWYGSERRMKILLHTNTDDGQSPSGTFLRLYNLSNHLNSLGADVGIAYPSISSGFKLCIKTNAVESVYQGVDITFALNILAVAVDKADFVPRIFWNVNGALTGIQLPLSENLSDIPSLVNICKDMQDVKICSTYLTLREELAKEDGRVKIMIETKALESIADSIVFFRRLRSELEKEATVVPVDFVVGSFDLTKFHDSPISFAFLNNQLIAVCLDNLDMLFFLEQLRSLTPNFDLLKAENLKSRCFYPSRGNYGMHVAELLGQYHGSMTDSVEEMESFAAPEKRMNIREYLTEYTGLLDALFVNRELISGDELKVVSAVGAICIRIFPQILTNLKSMGWNEAANAFQRDLKSAVWMDINAYLKEFLENENPLLAKSDYLRKKIEKVLEDYDGSTDLEDVIESINVIINDPDCPLELKNELQSYADAKPEMKLKGHVKALTKFVEQQFSIEKYFSLRNLMNFSDIISKKAPNEGNGTLIPDTVALYIERVLVDPVLEKFPGADKKLREYLEKKNYYQTLSLMSKIRYDHRLFMLHQCFYLLLDINDAEEIKKTLNKMGKLEFTQENYEDLWNSRKFSTYALKGLDSQSVLEAIATYQCPDDVVPTFMPVEFEEKLIPMLLADDDIKFEWKEEWESLDDALKVLQTIAVRKSIPKTFMVKLRDNMENNPQLKETLSGVNGLPYWDDNRRIFTQPWDISIIAEVINKIMMFIENNQESSINQLTETSNFSSQEENDQSIDFKNINALLETKTTDVKKKIGLEEYNIIKTVLQTPKIDYREMETALEKICPYVIQQAKLLSIGSLSPTAIYNYIKYPQVSDTNKPGVINFGKDEKIEKPNRLSRADILSYISNNSESSVALNILHLLGQFPTYALPLAIPDNESSIDEQLGTQFKLLYPLLRNIAITSDIGTGKSLTNNLFANPFKMTVVVRLGDGKTNFGKSSILNSVMANPNNLFSSVKDLQSTDLERPISNNGFLEFTCLTKNTCKSTLWKKLVDVHYGKLDSVGSNEILLMANLHGDGSDHYKILSSMKQIGCQFLVLLMPDTWENIAEKAQNFTSVLESEGCTLFAIVDPIGGVESENYTRASVISTEDIQLENTTVLENLILAAYENAQTIPSLETEHHNFVGVQEIETPQSRRLVQLVKLHSCKTTRKMFQENKSSFVEKWTQDEDYKSLLDAFINILRLPKSEREGSLTHVKLELAILSHESSLKSRNEFLQLIDELRTSVEADIPIADEVRNLHNQVKGVKTWIDDRTLGLEHFFREMGSHHENNISQTLYIGRYADHILNGNEIEIFNRDAGNIFWGKWLKDTLLGGMPESFKHKRVFVLSIVGLISSGKSTLLNALFGCKFTVSIAGGTRGIFMKLLFLEELLRNELKVDIIILFDTQGISSIGGYGDEHTLQNEQQLIALTIGLSNLTLLNSRGRSLGNMANVLESVFTKLATVPSLKFIPDFVLVHHQQKNRILQTEFPIVELTNSLRAVSDLTDRNELDVGVRERIGRRLNKIMRRVKHNDIVSVIGPYYTNGRYPTKIYHDGVVELYEKVLATIKESDKILTFEEWYGFSETFWQDLTCHEDNFPLKFKNSVEIQEYLDLQARISSINDLIDWAFLSHDPGLKNEIGEIENEGTAFQEENETQDENEMEILDSRDDRRNFRLKNVWKALRKMAGTCQCTLKGESGLTCQPCLEALREKEKLLCSLRGSTHRFETQEKLNDYIVNVRNSIWSRLNQTLISREMKPDKESGEILSTEYLGMLDEIGNVPVDQRWRVIQQWVSPWNTVIPSDVQITREVTELYRNLPHLVSRIKNENEPLPTLGSVRAFDLDYYNAIQVFYLEVPEEEEEAEEKETGEGEQNEEEDQVDCGCKGNKERSEFLDWEQKDWLEAQLKDIPELMWQSRCYDAKTKTTKWAYEVGMMREFKIRVMKIIDEFEQRTTEKLLPNFKWEAHLFAILYFRAFMISKQQQWNSDHQPLLQIDSSLTVPPQRT